MPAYGRSRAFWIPFLLLFAVMVGLGGFGRTVSGEGALSAQARLVNAPGPATPLAATTPSAAPDDALPDSLAEASTGPSTNATPFVVRFGETVTRAPLMSVFVLPGETTDLRIDTDVPADSIDVQSPERALSPAGNRRWTHRAPETPGVSDLTIRHPEGTSILRVFVLTPWDHQGTSLEGYRIGRYRRAARRGRPNYERPQGFVKVTEDTREMQLSPHFRLSQFLCKQTDAVPQFALVDTRLLQTLEQILAGVHARGHAATTLDVMSGFRTPAYNRSIGNTTVYSRHLYGDAADIFVDADGNGYMDDLTGDGRSTKADARYLAAVVKEAAANPGEGFVGGLGIYGPAPHRGPFVHVDLRGYRARW